MTAATRLVALSLAGLCVISSRPSHAQPPQMVNTGAGGQSCGEWLEVDAAPDSDRRTLKQGMLLSWTQGYLAGAAMFTGTIVGGKETATLEQAQRRFKTISGWAFDPPDANAVKFWLTKYCREHPLESLVEASYSLSAELFTKK
jgi:hypothetical protein